jgi:hypothetical protein
VGAKKHIEIDVVAKNIHKQKNKQPRREIFKKKKKKKRQIPAHKLIRYILPIKKNLYK